MRRVLVSTVAAAVLASTAAACGGTAGGYTITAEFERTVGLYENSAVKVMGANAGTVTSIEIDGDHVVVEMRIDDGVPLPSDVTATIAPLTLVGERNIVLSPPWQPGDDRLADGAVLGDDQTVIPVEPDEVLQALTDLAEAIDPDAVGELLSSGADAIRGQGETLNEALTNTAALTSTLADQDEQIMEAARNLNTVAASLNTRSEQFGRLVTALSEATATLAAERDNLAVFLDSVTRLSDAGTSILDAYEGTLPGDVAHLAELALVLESNIGSVDQLLAAFPRVGTTLSESYDPDRELIVLNISLTPTAATALLPLFDALGIPVPCIPVLGDVTCPS